ncbi:hypothetical protein [Pantoea trifolii]|uniref:hypothetical protein n=1 Tax=Candidatus Pantoea symbiotica TaxID=1884370 RepID=UPI002412F974|nr:hypothetical protein [Pantoea rodasii]
MSDYPITAFPTTESNWINENVRTEGMMLRDYFAAKAMQGILSNRGMTDNATLHYARWVAKEAYQVADIMLAARGQ